MNFLRVLTIALFLFFINIETTKAQIESKAQTAGVYFNGSKSFKEIMLYDKAHPTLNNKNEAENEENEEEDAMETNKRVAGIEGIKNTNTPPIFRQNNFANKSVTQPLAVSTCVNFEALPTNNTFIPPDIHGAVGFDHLVTTLNSEVRIQDKYSNVQSTVSLASFFSPTGRADIFDPRIMYDQLSNRFFFMACCTRKSALSGFVIAASQTPDPTGSWNFYTIDADPADTLWFDYGHMGFSSDKICVSGNMFNIVDGLNGDGGRMFTMSKSNLINGVPVGTVTRTRGIVFTTCPVLSFDNTGTCYAVGAQDYGLGQLILYNITGSPTSPLVNISGTVDYGSANGWAGGLGDVLPQSGTAIKINGGDARMQSAVLRNGKIFWADNFYWPLAAPTYCGIQYGSFNASTRATINFAGIWNATGTEMFCYPNIAVNADEDVAVAFSYFSTTSFPSAGVAYGTNNLSLTYNIIKPGEAKYTSGYDNSGRLRWGDYMSASVDPTDDKSFWTLAEYAKNPTSTWSSWWTKVCPNSCIANYNLTFNLPSNSVRKYEATNSISSTAIINSSSFIKYDAGSVVTLQPGFLATAGCNYRAFIEGCGGNQ
jgi:hypothetical protein